MESATRIIPLPMTADRTVTVQEGTGITLPDRKALRTNHHHQHRLALIPHNLILLKAILLRRRATRLRDAQRQINPYDFPQSITRQPIGITQRSLILSLRVPLIRTLLRLILTRSSMNTSIRRDKPPLPRKRKLTEKRRKRKQSKLSKLQPQKLRRLKMKPQ